MDYSALLLVSTLVGMLPLAPVLGQADAPEGSQTILGIRGDSFTLNGRPTFLLGFSYYGALGTPEEFIRRDLEDFQRHGFNWLRVWATWSAFGTNVSAVDAQGKPREPFLPKLQWIVAQCDRRGMIVDVTLTRGAASGSNPAGAPLPSVKAHQCAVNTLIKTLKLHRNWYLDLANERDVRDERYVSPTELTQLRSLVASLDPQRLVTASYGGHDLSAGDIRESLEMIGLDFLSVHRPRAADSPSQTQAQTVACLETMNKIGRVVPVLYQEPFRRGYSQWEPAAADFLADLRGAVTGGAAGWCFHNGSQRTAPNEQPRRSFDMRGRRLIDQLDGEETKLVAAAAAVLELNSAPPGR